MTDPVMTTGNGLLKDLLARRFTDTTSREDVNICWEKPVRQGNNDCLQLSNHGL